MKGVAVVVLASLACAFAFASSAVAQTGGMSRNNLELGAKVCTEGGKLHESVDQHKQR
jgi:hypothetical protein